MKVDGPIKCELLNNPLMPKYLFSPAYKCKLVRKQCSQRKWPTLEGMTEKLW